MAKKVLIVEQSLAVRGIAESLLRQNGYDVVAAESAETAKEILNDTKIDLLLIASDIVTGDGQRFYEYIGGESGASTGPFLVLHDASLGEDLPFPSEVIINKPFTPRDFLNSVAAFTGGMNAGQTESVETPFTGSDVEEDIIDAALGLDKVEVDESEVIGNDTGIFRLNNKKVTTESMIGFEHKVPSDDTTGITVRKKIDQISVPVDQADAPSAQTPDADKHPIPRKPVEESAEFLGRDTSRMPTDRTGHMTESSKIEIVTDQYGIDRPDEFATEADDGNHDYNWFINELKKDGDDETPLANDSGSLHLTDNSDSLHPSAPPPVSEAPEPTPEQAEAPGHNEAVDKFISEFKKEMEKISSDVETDVPITNIAPPETIRHAEPAINWDEAVDKLDNADLRVFSQDVKSALAGAIAGRVVAMLDEERLYQIIREVVESSLKKRV